MKKNNKRSLMRGLKSFGVFLFLMPSRVIFLIKFFILLSFTFLKYFIGSESQLKLNKPQRKIIRSFFQKLYNKFYILILKIFDERKKNEVRYSDLIFMAIRNLSAKKNRTFMTIGGMAIGFGAVILLLSVGYGFEKLVISEVASLAEMKQVVVNVSQGSPLKFDLETISNIAEIEGVDSVLPIIMSVSKVEYNNAVSDVIVYGVNTKYLSEAGLYTLKGEWFEDDEVNLKAEVGKEVGIVAGATTLLISNESFEKEISKVQYSINPMVWKPVYKNPTDQSELLGYTKREPGKHDAVEVWGGKYKSLSPESAADVEGREYNPWVKGDFPLWEKKDCDIKDPGCFDGQYRVLKNNDSKRVEEGYITKENLIVERYQLNADSPLEIYEGKFLSEVIFKFRDGETSMFFDSDQLSISIPVENSGALLEYKGQLVYGNFYENSNDFYVKDINGRSYGYWVKSSIQLWGDVNCENACNVYSTVSKDGFDVSKNFEVYFKASDLIFPEGLADLMPGDVLGVNTDQDGEVLGLEGNSLINLEDLEDFDWVSLSKELEVVGDIEKQVKSIPKEAQRIALINNSMLNLLSIDLDDAVGEEFNATIIFDNKLFSKTNSIVESEPIAFKIAGVVSDTKSPTFYIPFSDLLVEGLNNVSSLKIILTDVDSVSDVRGKVESLGFQTNSVVDTVEGISTLFNGLRIGLLILGLIALGVGSLGMFNTLTVSLLEQTREIGLLKTMGLKSKEAKVLFLAESIIMSVMGGVTGLVLGLVLGKIISFAVSAVAISQGYSYLEVTYIPWALAFSLILLSSIVGIVTGWYPAERAKKISALNALRYE